MHKHTVFLFLGLFLLNACRPTTTPFGEPSPAVQPYEWITASKTGVDVAASPDPLVAWRWDYTDADDDLQIYTLRPVTVSASPEGSFSRLHSLLHGRSGRVRVSAPGDIMFDFGQVNAAWLEFDSDDFNGVVEMSISEYNEPAILNEWAQNPVKTLQPVRYGNTYRLELNDELYEGVRYGWIHVKSLEAPWHIDNVRLVCQIKPTNYDGAFHSDEDVLSGIWYTGAYGVKLNLLKDHFGAILMERSDRHSWTGDAYASQAASLVAFGNYDFVLTNLHHTAEQYNDILSYALYWIYSLVDYYNYSGDRETVLYYIDNARNKLDQAYAHYGKDPHLTFYGWDERLGAGFEDHSCRESQNAYKMLSIGSWLEFARMMHSVGYDEIGQQYKGYALEKIAELRQDPEWYRDFGIHAAADAIIAGFTTKQEQDAMFHLAFADRLNRLSYSPFNQYFILQALAIMGRYDEALETIMDCWGGQIDYGGTTFFEVFRPTWNDVLGYNDAPPNNQCGYTSLCHPWGGGVVKWLSEEVLGVRPTLPGFENFDVIPNTGSGLTAVRGSVPTPAGIVQVSHDPARGLYTLDVPEGLTARMGIPLLGRSLEMLQYNGDILYRQGDPMGTTEGHISLDDNVMFIAGLEGGMHRFELRFDGVVEPYQGTDWIFPATVVGQDETTSGNWGGVYGSDGYVLCAYYLADGQISNKLVLPDYVSEVVLNKERPTFLAAGTDDPRAPASNASNAAVRNAGGIFTQCPLATYQTMTLDVHMEKGTERQFALYAVDWDNAGRRIAIEMFDLESKEIIAPVQIIEDFSQGKYMVFRYDAPVRFRINHVRGPNATLNAIFFDTPAGS